MAQVHWYARALPNLGFAFCGALLAFIFWSLGARSFEPYIAGACVGLLDGVLGLLGRRATLPHLRTAATPGAAIMAYMHSPWTRARNLIGIGCLVVLGIILARRLEQRADFTAFSLFGSFATISFLLRALILAPWGNRAGCPLTPRWSGRVKDKVPSPNAGARAAQLNR